MSNSSKESCLKKDDPKYVDLLDEDTPIAGQKFVCLSFISPERIIKQRELYFFKQFLKQYDIKNSMSKFTEFLHFLSYKYNLDFDTLTKDFDGFILDEKEKLYTDELEDAYKNYIDAHEENLEKKFNDEYGFQTSVRGIKVRGTFPSQEEAELRCKMIRELDPNHDVFVGPVGLWLPWDPEAYKTQNVEYMEETLNQLMHEKQKNELEAKQKFEERLKETKRKAIEENIENARSSGNKLTQTLNNQGNLVNIGNCNTTENAILQSNKQVSNELINKELFEGDNIVTDKNTDHGLENILSNIKNIRVVNSEEHLEEVD